MPGTALVQDGIRAAQGGDLARAAELFQAALKADPDNADALHFLGRMVFQSGQRTEAVEMMRRALTLSPDKADAHNDLGLMLRRMGDDDGARASLESALRLEPNNPPALNNLGTIQRNAGEFDAAIATLKRAVEIAPEFSEAHVNLGNCYAYSERMTEALDHYRISMSLGGAAVDPIRVAKTLYALKRKDEAIALLDRYLAEHPNHEPSRYQLSAMRGEAMDCANEAYIAQHFDGFAESFDVVLGRLNYQGPKLVADALAARFGPPKADKVILDLGCGTGLCGPLVAPFKSQLIGVDLSVEMLRQAAQRGCYDGLEVAELQSYLARQESESVDIAISVDTLIYIGALERVMDGARDVLRPGGVFIATVECLPDGDPREYSVDGSGRFKHARRYVEEAGSASGLSLVSLTDAVIRKEAGEPANGLVFAMTKK